MWKMELLALVALWVVTRALGGSTPEEEPACETVVVVGGLHD